MSRGRGGWFRGPVLAAGVDYAISIDGGPPQPDPRSRWQPEGIDRPSRWIDHLPPRPLSRPPVPLRQALIYELHVGTFSPAGTFSGAIVHLPHLVDLGVTHVELMPIAQFSGAHGWGYDGVYPFAPHAAYGGPAGLRALVGECHQLGLAVIVDVVHGRLGPEGDHTAALGPYWTSRHRTPWGDAINLDGEGSREVRRFMIDSARSWLRDYGADGLRLDAIHTLHDASERHLVAELVDEVRALERDLGRTFVVIGEHGEHDPRAVVERPHGWGLDAHWNDDFHHALHALLTGERGGRYGAFADPDALAQVLERGYVRNSAHPPFRGGPHDAPFGALPRDRLVAYTQSHDQVGNRAAGERLHQLAGLDRARIAAALLFVSPFVPMLFQGEEWAASTPFCYFCDLQAPELREAVRARRHANHAHAHAAAGWQGEPVEPAELAEPSEPSDPAAFAAPGDPLDPATRERCVLRWQEREDGVHAQMLLWYRRLAAARRAHPALRDPAPASTRVRWRGAVLEVERGELVLACNLADEPARLDPGHGGEVLLASPPTGLARAAELPPCSCVLFRR